MGGGGVALTASIRAAAKAAGIGVFNSGLRNKLPENSVFNNNIRARYPDTHIPNHTSSGPHLEPAAIETLDNWEFAGSEDGSVILGICDDDDKSWVFFGDPPTLEEAKNATTQLKEVLEKSYDLSSTRNSIQGLSCLSSVSSLRIVQPTCYDTSLRIVQPTCYDREIPKHAIQAFKFLTESQPLQNVVASVASDPNVWKAVFSNPDLQEFLESHKIDSMQHQYPWVEESSDDGDCDDDIYKSRRILDLNEIWKNIKVMVVELMNESSDLFKGFLGGIHDKKVALLASATGAGIVPKALGPSLMGLVVMVMMVVAFRRTPA